LTSLTIEDIGELDNIGDQAFANCILTKVTINGETFTSCGAIIDKYSQITPTVFQGNNRLENCD